MAEHRSDSPRWTFLTNHGHVLLCLAMSPELRLRDVAERVGVTERAVQRIVSDLEEGGYLTRRRSGRQNEYEINADEALRHPLESHCTVRSLMEMVEETANSKSRRASKTEAARRPRRRIGATGGR